MPRRLHPALLLAIGAAVCLSGGAPAAAIATFDLGPADVTASSVTLPVSLAFTGAPGDTVEAIQLSVSGSDPLLTGGGADFSRFSFALNAAALPGWLELSPLGSGLGLYAPADPAAGPFLAPGPAPVDIGTLTVNLAGLPGDTTLFVTLAGGPAGLGTDAGGTVGGALVPSFAAADPAVAQVQFADPARVAFTTPGSVAIPEPGSYVLVGVGTLGLLAYRSRPRRERLTLRTRSSPPARRLQLPSQSQRA